MSYQEKLELVKASLIFYCTECITENWERMFDMWLSCEADMEFGHGYQNKFKEQFSPYMNSKIEDLLWLSAKNLIFAINAFMSYKEDAGLENVLSFTEKFISEQLDDFDNWCEEVAQAMYEETSEYERDIVCDRKEDDPCV